MKTSELGIAGSRHSDSITRILSFTISSLCFSLCWLHSQVGFLHVAGKMPRSIFRLILTIKLASLGKRVQPSLLSQWQELRLGHMTIWVDYIVVMAILERGDCMIDLDGSLGKGSGGKSVSKRTGFKGGKKISQCPPWMRRNGPAALHGICIDEWMIQGVWDLIIIDLWAPKQTRRLIWVVGVKGRRALMETHLPSVTNSR